MPSLDMAPNVGHVSYKRSSISKATNLACGWVPTSMNYPISPALPGADEAAVDTAREAALRVWSSFAQRIRWQLH